MTENGIYNGKFAVCCTYLGNNVLLSPMLQNSVRHLRRGRLSCDVIALTHKQTGDVAYEEVEVATAQHKVKKRGGQFCVAGGPYGTRCTNSTYSHGVSMHTFPAIQPTNHL